MFVFIPFNLWPETSWGASTWEYPQKYADMLMYMWNSTYYFLTIPELLSSSWTCKDEINFPVEGLAQAQHLSLAKALFWELKYY